MTTTPIIKCRNDDCGNPALLNAWPNGKSNRWFPQICADCAVKFYLTIETAMEAHLMNAKLIKADTVVNTPPAVDHNMLRCNCGGLLALDHHGRVHHHSSDDNSPCRLRLDMTRSREIVALADAYRETTDALET